MLTDVSGVGIFFQAIFPQFGTAFTAIYIYKERVKPFLRKVFTYKDIGIIKKEESLSQVSVQR